MRDTTMTQDTSKHVGTSTTAATSATKQRRHIQKGLTFFFSVDSSTQIALHKSPSGHYSYITYSKGVQLHPSQRTTLQRAAALLYKWSESDLQKLFNS